MHNPFIIGDKLYLRGIEKKDLCGDYIRWINDSEVNYYMYTGYKPGNVESLEKEYEEIVSSDKNIVFAVVDKKTDTYIGNVGLYSIDSLSRSAEYRIIIGEKEYWNKGYGEEAGKLVVKYAFDKLNLNKVYLGVNKENIKAVKSYKRIGFVEEGILREEVYRNSRYYDAIRMSILRSEYYKNQNNK